VTTAIVVSKVQLARLSTGCSTLLSASNGGCGRHRPHRGLKVKSHTHCMETQGLCKNIEGDPAKPNLAATTCWGHGIKLRGRVHSLEVRKGWWQSFYSSQSMSPDPFYSPAVLPCGEGPVTVPES
jgi:hypothetical protein